MQGKNTNRERWSICSPPVLKMNKKKKTKSQHRGHGSCHGTCLISESFVNNLLTYSRELSNVFAHNVTYIRTQNFDTKDIKTSVNYYL